MSTAEIVVWGLWAAATVWVVWWGLAHWFLKQREKPSEPEVDPTAEQLLEAESTGLASAWETIGESPNQS